VAYWAATFLAGLALVLTLAGIYGVLAYLVAQRTREIGMRLALGDGPGQVVGIVMKQSLHFAAIGTALGSIGAFGFSRLLASQISAIEPFDARAFAIGIGVVFAVSAAVAWVPSVRASRIDPASSLRLNACCLQTIRLYSLTLYSLRI